MGATKRAAEKLIQSYNENSNTTFMAVRFGNVLRARKCYTNFSRADQRRRPHNNNSSRNDKIFYVYTEASQLILQCGAIGRDGEIFLLEMGKPIRIVQMAKDLIRLSGFEPDVDIPIVLRV